MKIAVVALCLLTAIGLWGEAKDCINPSLVVADGRLVNSPQFEGSFNGHNPTYWYAFYGQSMHSYSVEFVATLDNENISTAIQFVNLIIWGPSDIGALQANGCLGPSTLSLTATQSYSPTVSRSKYGTGLRASFVAASSGLNIVAISNAQGAGPYSYRVTDTSMFNPRWSTYSNYDTTWGFTNMSDMAITGTLYVFNVNNQLLSATTVSVPANGQVFRASGSSDMNLPRNSSGSAIFSHNGPPSAILADSYMANGSGTIVYTKFESRYSR